MKASLLFLLSCLLHTAHAPGEEASPSYREEVIDFKNIQQVLENDRLIIEMQKKQTAKRKQDDPKKNAAKYNIPGEMEFWTFFTEYWIVKNVTALKWDFEKTDYGLDKSFRSLLEGLGFYEKKFKILLVNTNDITHFALPSDNHENIFLLSLPFVQALDLSKLEISLLLMEDFLRAQQGHFKKMATNGRLKTFLGGNFQGKKLDQSLLAEISKKYDSIVFDRGFNFQQQFKVTQQMNSMLKSNNGWWNAYYKTVEKIDHLVKNNVLYKKYLRIYPSPELQLSWLKPKRDKIL